MKHCSLCGAPTRKYIRTDSRIEHYCAACKIAIQSCSILHREVYDVPGAELQDVARESEIAEANAGLQHAFQREFAGEHPDSARHVFECPDCGLHTMPAPHTTKPRCYRCVKQLHVEDAELAVRSLFRDLHRRWMQAEGNAAKCRARLRFASNKSESWMAEQLGMDSLTSDTEWIRKYLNWEEL